jgi:hypothetical protein
LKLTLSAEPVARRLAIVVVCLCAASVAGQGVRVLSDSVHVQEATRVFKVDRESSIPTYFSALMLLAAAAALAVVARRERGRPYAAHWKGLAAIFLYLSVDEAVGIHELAIDPTRELLGVRGFLLFTWVVPAAALLVVFALAYWRFWRQLPGPLRRGLAAAGALYVGSAVGIEMIGARLHDSFGQMDVRYALVALAEEAGEMFAVVLLLRALLRHLGGERGALEIKVAAADARADAAPADATPAGRAPARRERGRGEPAWSHTSPDAARAHDRAAEFTR